MLQKIKSLEGENEMKTQMGTFWNRAKEILGDKKFEYGLSKMKMDDNINEKLDDIIFFRGLLEKYDLPQKRVRQLEKIENEIFNQLLAYSDIQKGNIKADVALIGTFNSGKSTIVNSFLKEEICPTDPNPTTSSVTKFYFSNTREMMLDGKPISQSEYIQKVRHENLGKETKTYFFEYGHNADIFNSIVLYDTPGFGNSANRNDDKVTEDILKRVDVVIYIIDINKGSLDKEDLKRLMALKNQENKKFYCIMNKADGKSPKGIERIQKQIESFDIFDKIIAYSAKNVVNASTRYSIEKYLDLTRRKIYSKSKFESHIRGEIVEGRRNKERYLLRLDGEEVDGDSIDALVQRKELEDIFRDISLKKQEIMKRSFMQNEKRLRLKSKSILSDILSEIGTYVTNEKHTSFLSEYENMCEKVKQFELQRIRTIMIIYLNAYKKALKDIEVSNDEKSYWSTPWHKIFLSKATFMDNMIEIKNIYKDIINFMDDVIGQLEKKYGKIEGLTDINLLNDEFVIDSFLGILYYYDLERYGFFDKYYGIYDIEYYDESSDVDEEIESIYTTLRMLVDLVEVEYPEHLLLTSLLMEENRDFIMKKAGMLTENYKDKARSKKELKKKIENYLKGVKNA